MCRLAGESPAGLSALQTGFNQVAHRHAAMAALHSLILASKQVTSIAWLQLCVAELCKDIVVTGRMCEHTEA